MDLHLPRFAAQLSSLNLVAASAYKGRQSRRLMVTTITAITTVAASSTRKLPLSVAWLITAPSPVVEKVRFWNRKYSATMLAFQAPPDAVTKPVIKYGKIPGRINRRQRSILPRLYTSQTSL